MNGETTFINSKAPKSLYISSNVLPELLFVKCPLGKSFENILVILLMSHLNVSSAFLQRGIGLLLLGALKVCVTFINIRNIFLSVRNGKYYISISKRSIFALWKRPKVIVVIKNLFAFIGVSDLIWLT